MTILSDFQPARRWRGDARLGRELAIMARFGALLTIYELTGIVGGTATTWIMARLGTDSLAAGGMVGSITLLVYLAVQGIMQGVSISIAQALGSGRDDLARAAAIMGLAMAGVLGLLLTALLSLLPDLFRMLPGSPAAHELASHYVRSLLPGLTPMCILFALRAVSFSLQKSRAVVMISWGSMLFNVALSYALTFGALGAPALGIMGLGVSASISAFLQLVIQMAVIAVHPQTRCFFSRIGDPASWWMPSLLIRCLAIGFPISAVLFIEGFLFTASYFLMAAFGADQLAGHALAQQWMAIAFMVPVAISQAVMVRAAFMIGARDGEGCARVATASVMLTLIATGLIAIAFLLAGLPLARMLTGDSAATGVSTIQTAATFLAVGAVTQILRGLVVVQASILRGCRDTGVALWTVILGYWGAGLGLAVLAAFGLGLKGVGIWLGLTMGFLVASLSLALRIRGKLRNIDITIARVEAEHAQYRPRNS